MESLDDYLRAAEPGHGHICAGQVLGVRMAMLGLKALGIEDPQGQDRKRLVTFVEIDRCATDAVAVVTGCRLGKRALKFRDWGKMAATFVDVNSGRAIRIAARESSKSLARQIHPEIENKNQQQMLAYRGSETLRNCVACFFAPIEKCAHGRGSCDLSDVCATAIFGKKCKQRHPYAAFSYAFASRRIVLSAKCFPKTCIPIGSFSLVTPT